MKFIDDILQSISGNTRTKVDDPFIGAFIGSWIVCNWSHLAILIWGEGKAAERINAFSKYLEESDVIAINSIIVIPLFMAVLFLFAFPWLSLFLKSMQKLANERLFQQAISIEVSKTRQQEILNRQKLLADPDKRFLEQNVQLDIDRRREINEQLKLRTVRFKESAAAAVAAAAEAKNRESQAQLEEEKKQRIATVERQRFTVESARLKSALASNRFPSSYSFMLAIEESLKEDGVQLSLAGLGEVVATMFGYKDFQSLLGDEDFNNSTLYKVVYILYDPANLASRLESVVLSEEGNDDSLDVDLLFGHVMSVFEGLEYKMITEEQVGDLCREFSENHRYEFLEHDGLSGPIAESDTVYDDVEIGDLESINVGDGLRVVFSGSASGTHRREDDVAGRDIAFSVEIKSALLLGAAALGDLEVGDVSGELVDNYYEREDEAETN